jgi:hypothetical protein
VTEPTLGGDREPAARSGRVPAAPSASRARARRKPTFVITIAAAAATFMVLFELLAFQLRSGNDPAVGSGALTASAPAKVQHAAQTPGTAPTQANSTAASVVSRTSGATQTPTPVAQQQPLGSGRPAIASGGNGGHSTHPVRTRSSGSAGTNHHRLGEDDSERENAA